MWDTVWSALSEHAVPLGALAALFTIIGIAFSPIRLMVQRWREPERVEIVNLHPPPKVN